MLLFYQFAPTILSQAAPQKPDRHKEFGKSLKKYGKNAKKDIRKPNKTNDEDTIRVETTLVVNDILVVNQKGDLVTGLKKGDFIVKEDEVSQEISTFSFGKNVEIPRSIVLLVDYSTSLLPYIDNSIQAAKLLVDKLNPNDRMAIITDDVELLVDFTSDKSLLKNTLDDLTLRALSGSKVGKSLPFSALLVALNEMFDGEESRPIIIFQSDGDEFSFLKPIKYFSELAKEDFTEQCKTDTWFCERDFAFDDIKEGIGRTGVVIYSVIPGIRFSGLAEDEKLKRGELSLANKLRVILKKPDEKYIAKFSKKYAPTEALEKTAWQTAVVETSDLSGGFANFLEKPEDSEMIYSNILRTIENRYVIGYYPQNETRDGKQRKVKIEVKGHPEYTILGRKSYFAPQDEK